MSVCLSLTCSFRSVWEMAPAVLPAGAIALRRMTAKPSRLLRVGGIWGTEGSGHLLPLYLSVLLLSASSCSLLPSTPGTTSMGFLLRCLCCSSSILLELAQHVVGDSCLKDCLAGVWNGHQKECLHCLNVHQIQSRHPKPV